MGRVLTLNEAADMLRVNEGTLREHLKRGAVPGRKIGRQWRISEDALNDWLEGVSAGAISEAERRANVDQLAGKYAHIPGSVEDFLQHRRQEAEREERQWKERQTQS
ncbi:MAG: helix-turn-helix domain-containing protein [Armatimonadetes bacterium]|nr:helix-turn-helix domain-containing protein [Armatimonadota bacterium]